MTIDGAPAAGATQTGWSTLVGNVITHPDCRHFSASSLMTTRLFFSRPRNQADYEDWAGWAGTHATAALFGATYLDWNGWVPRSFPMSAIYVIFEATGTAVNYNVVPYVQFMTRWDAGNVMAGTHRISQTTEQKAFDAMAAHAHAAGPQGSPTTPGPSIIKSFVSGASNHLAATANAVGSAAARHAIKAAANYARSSRKFDPYMSQREAAIMDELR